MGDPIPLRGAKTSLNATTDFMGGLTRLHFHDKDPTSDLVCFCEVVGGDRFHIDKPNPAFNSQTCWSPVR